ncbi:MAG: aldolase/citrate lyase family protein [Pseudomonadota bacterium]
MTLRDRVRGGEQVSGAMSFEFFSPGVPQLMRLAGAEFLIYDMEHSGVSIETLKMQAAACRGLPITPLARPPVSDYHFLARLLDIGMKGVMVPMVESAEEAASIVEACRYPPAGRRGAAFGFAHDDYEPGAPADKIETANDGILVIAQVETERGLDAAEEIAAVDGIDVLWIGQFDLTNFLGVPGQFDAPVYRDACARITAAARAHGKALGAMAPNSGWARDYRTPRPPASSSRRSPTSSSARYLFLSPLSPQLQHFDPRSVEVAKEIFV